MEASIIMWFDFGFGLMIGVIIVVSLWGLLG
jgi:hypothetical protein